MNTELRYATLQDAQSVALNLRHEDKEEMAGVGHTPFYVLLGYLFSETTFAFDNTDGELAGIGGLIPDDDGDSAYIWMLCTPAVTKMGLTALRQAKDRLDELSAPYKMLFSLTDSRNKLHHRLLRYFGFKALRAVPQHPYHIPYYEVVKLCVTP